MPLVPVASKIDAIVGLNFIGLGFFGQLAGTDSDVSTIFSSCRSYAISALIILIVGGGSYRSFRKILFARYIAYIYKGEPK